MTRLPSTRMTPEQAADLARRDKRRILMMSFLALVLIASYVFSANWRAKKEAEQGSQLYGEVVSQQVPQERLLIPEFDQVEMLDQIRDSSPEDRVLEDGGPLDSVLAYARLLTGRHLLEMGLRELDPELTAEIQADPKPFRIQPLRARGELVALSTRRRDGETPEYVGSVRLEQGGYAHFVLRREPSGIEPGHFVMLEGLFLKLFNVQVEGDWREGPQLVGGRLQASFPDRSHPDGLEALLARVRDDELSDFTGEPWEALWEFMRKVREPADDSLWAAAPEVNNELLQEVFSDGDTYRGQRFRFPICINVDTWIERPDENPARVSAFTRGWIGNMTWKGQAKVVQFYMPGEHEELLDHEGSAHFVMARGYFVKNLIYEARRGATERVPLFVMESVEAFIPPEDPLPRRILWAIFGGTLFFIGLFTFLISRDKRRSRVLQEELVRRRRARRSRLAESV